MRHLLACVGSVVVGYLFVGVEECSACDVCSLGSTILVVRHLFDVSWGCIGSVTCWVGPWSTVICGWLGGSRRVVDVTPVQWGQVVLWSATCWVGLKSAVVPQVFGGVDEYSGALLV